MTSSAPKTNHSISKSSAIVIVGAGVFGLSSAYHLSLAGYTNITVLDKNNHDEDRYNPLHGSDAASGDINKFFRTYYEDKVAYSRLAAEALTVWEQWNSDILKLSEAEKKQFLDDDLELVRLSGGARLGKGTKLSGVELLNLEGFTELGLRSTQYDLNSKRDLERAQLVGVCRKLRFVDEWRTRVKGPLCGVYDSVGRMLKADKACFYVRLLLAQRGVVFHWGDAGEAVEFVGADASRITAVRVKNNTLYSVDHLVVSAGPWTTALVPALYNRTLATLANVVYVELPKSRQDLIDKYSAYPHIQWKTTSSEYDRIDSHFPGEGGFAFFPPTRAEGVLKLNLRQTKFVNPVRIGGKDISVPRTLGNEPLPKTVLQEAKEVLRAIAPDVVVLPGIRLRPKMFWYTDSVNSDFVIDFVPGYENVIVATGGSSHGFKFLPVLGRTVVDRFSGASNEYTELFRWKNPEDIKVDNYGLRDTDLGAKNRRNLSTVEVYDESDLVFSAEELQGLETAELD